MSQIQSFIMSEGPAGPILTLTGNIGGPVMPTGGNINIVGGSNNIPPTAIPSTSFGFATVQGNASTLTIAPMADTIATADNVITFFPIARTTVPAGNAVVMSAHVIGFRSDFSAGCGGFAVGCARRQLAGGTIFIGNNVLSSEDSAGGIPEFGVNVDGNDIAVFVRGVNLENWNWTCTFQYQFELL